MDVPTWRWHGHFQVATGRMPGFAGILEKCGLRKDRGRYRGTDTTRGCRLSAEERLYRCQELQPFGWELAGAGWDCVQHF